jgi:hypothetical protein
LSVTVSAQVVATHRGADERIDVAWTDPAGLMWTIRLTPYEPDRWSVGDAVDLRYDPDNPDDVVPVDTGSFEGFVRDRIFWSGGQLIPGVLLAWAWTWRLGRWALGTVTAPQTATVEARAATYLITWHNVREPGAFWLRIREPDGSTWYQRAMWSRRVVALAHTGVDGTRPNATLRRCPGLRRMFLVEVPGVGRIWPASTARPRMPALYALDRLAPGPTGIAQRPRHNLIVGGLAAVVLVVMALSCVGEVGVGYLAAFAVAGWLWLGATPIQGIRG